MTFDKWHDDFSRFAEDLYPRRYSQDYVKLLAEMGEEVRRLARRLVSNIQEEKEHGNLCESSRAGRNCGKLG